LLVPVQRRGERAGRQHVLDEREALADCHQTRAEAREADGLPRRRTARALLGHALAFTTWRSLVCEQGLNGAAAADLMTDVIGSA